MGGDHATLRLKMSAGCDQAELLKETMNRGRIIKRLPKSDPIFDMWPCLTNIKLTSQWDLKYSNNLFTIFQPDPKVKNLNALYDKIRGR